MLHLEKKKKGQHIAGCSIVQDFTSGLGIASGYSGMVGRPDTASMVEAKYPALRFKQQLTAYVREDIWDNEI